MRLRPGCGGAEERSGDGLQTVDQAQAELETFDEKWGQRFPVITKAWLDAWEHVIPFLAFPAEVRRVIYTTNAIGSRINDHRRYSTGHAG